MITTTYKIRSHTLLDCVPHTAELQGIILKNGDQKAPHPTRRMFVIVAVSSLWPFILQI